MRAREIGDRTTKLTGVQSMLGLVGYIKDNIKVSVFRSNIIFHFKIQKSIQEYVLEKK